MESKHGRPKVYSDQELKEMLTDFALNNAGKVTFLGLEKSTGIKRHVWSRRMKREIDSLNDRILNIDGDKLEQIPLPNIGDIVDKNWNNKERLVSELESINRYIQNLWDKAVQQEKSEQKIVELQQKVLDLTSEVSYLKEDRDYYKSELEKTIVENTYQHKQEENGMKNPMSDLKKTSNKWKEQFPNLFD